MNIANPIYDTVFKYMMNDSKIAKMLLSAIIGEKIVELDFQPKDGQYNKKEYPENGNEVGESVELGLHYLDFNAKIETETGEYKTVIIELQKKKRETDIMRFRQYLGSMYQSLENTSDKKRIKSRQIYCIYLLNYSIGYPDVPIVKVGQNVTDAATGEELHVDSEFIKSTNHLQWIVQVKYLKGKRRTETEEILGIFNQENITKDQHILNIDESLLPEKYRPIIRKLQEACASKELIKQMQAEDLYQTEIEIKDELIAESKKIIEENKKSLAEKDQSLIEKDQSLAEKDQSLAEKDQSLAEKDQSLAEKDQSLAEKDKLLEEQKKEIEELKRLYGIKK